MSCRPDFRDRRSVLFQAGCGLLAIAAGARPGFARSTDPERRWFEAADAMKRLALSWGDQPYGAVIVINGVLAGEGPSRVVRNQDVNAHAEREAIRDAQRRLGTQDLAGAVLYSTSRPCSLCEAAAARAKVGRMIYGAGLTDAGSPKGGGPD